MRAVKTDVPQGLVLRPVLYMIYVNELPEVTMKANECDDDIHVNHD